MSATHAPADPRLARRLRAWRVTHVAPNGKRTQLRLLACASGGALSLAGALLGEARYFSAICLGPVCLRLTDVTDVDAAPRP